MIRFFGIMLVFLSCVFGGAAAAKKQLSVLEGIERAEKLVSAIIEGILSERSTMTEILQGIVGENEKTDGFICSVLKNSAGKRIVLKKEIVERTGFCSDGPTAKALEETFEIFGTAAAEEQVHRLKHIQNGIAKRREQLLKPVLERARLARSFGAIAGLLAAVILI